MDWDERFSKTELYDNLDDLGIWDRPKYKLDELLVRTTKNTRSGQEFGFKPRRLSIGILTNGQFYEGFTSVLDRKGRNVNTDEDIASSFWIRFREQVRQ